MASSSSDHNWLFGFLALQNNFISREEMIAAVSVWMQDKSKPLDQILRERKALADNEHQLLAGLVEIHLARHDGDPQKSLAALSSIGSLADPEIEAMLSSVSANRPDTPIDDTPATSLDPDATLTIGTRSSAGLRFRILRTHAKGGLGEVSVAQDTELNREVALKEIQGRFADDPNSRSRFLLEAEVTGRLEHPGIVPVYGLGQFADGRPFYAMRFIRGDSLKDATERYHNTGGQNAGAKSLELRRLLSRFVDVCQAIEYAHSRGVLHRDLKPDNVMLGKYGETLVVDWGLAKLAGRDEETKVKGETTLQLGSARDSAPTQLGSAVGTPAYMPPEQAAGRLDELGPASDVYSLGATLYHLLTGQAPLTDNDLDTVLRRVQQGDFPPPRQIKPETPKPLEAICLKAMATRPRDRYVSPQELADDVERFLADEPVSAYVEPVTLRARRWMRRHRTLVTAASVLLVTAVVALTVGIFAVGRAQQQTQAALRAEAKRREQTRAALDEMSSQVMYDLLAQQPEPTPETRVFLKRALTYYEQFAADTGNDESARGGVAEAHMRVAHIRRMLGEAEAAEAALRRASELYSELAADFPETADYRHGLAESRFWVGNSLSRSGRRGEAEVAYKHALDIQQKLVDDLVGPPQRRQLLARIHHSLGQLFRARRREADAEQSLKRALTIQQQLVADFRESREYRLNMATTMQDLALAQRSQGRDQAAEETYLKAIPIVQALADEFSRNSNYRMRLGVLLNDLAVLFKNRRDFDPAESYLLKALAVRQKAAADFPNDIDQSACLGGSYLNLGNVARIRDRIQDSVQWYDKGIRSLQAVLDRDEHYLWARRLLVFTHEGRAESFITQGRFADALRDWDHAIRLDQPQFRLDDPQLTVRLTLRRALMLVHLGPQAVAVAVADKMLADASPVTLADASYFAAAVYAAASERAKQDAKLSEHYAQQAMAALRTALTNGTDGNNVKAVEFKADSDFEALRGREDFAQLLREWKKLGPP